MSAGDHIWPDIAAALPGRQYRDVILIGQGALGRIYRAFHEPSGKPVAVKVLPLLTESLVQRAKRERRLLARLRAHENVVRFVDARLASPPSLILVLEWIEGPDLLTLIRSAGALPETVVAAIARQICRGLAHLHAQRLLHRDVKPSNVLLARSGVVKIADFGLLFGAEDEGDDEGTRVGTTVGTPGFMAPELFLAAGRGHTERSDLYALGSLIFHALAGRPVLDSSTRFADAMKVILSGDFDLTLPQGCAEGWTALFRDLMAADPAKRPASASEVLARLDAIVPGDPRGDARVVADFLDLASEDNRPPVRVPTPMLDVPTEARNVKDLLLSLRSEIAEIGAVVSDLTLVLAKARQPAPPGPGPVKSAPGWLPRPGPRTVPARPASESGKRPGPGQPDPRTPRPAPASTPRDEPLDRNKRSILSLRFPEPAREPVPTGDDEATAEPPDEVPAASKGGLPPHVPADPLENRIEGTFSSIRDRLRATWRLGLVMTVILFAVFVAMVVTAIITGLTTGKATLSIIFGGAGAASILGVVIWKPFDRIFFATVVLQQLEIIQLNYHRAMTGTRNERQAAFTDTLRQLDLLLTRILAQGRTPAQPESG